MLLCHFRLCLPDCSLLYGLCPSIERHVAEFGDWYWLTQAAVCSAKNICNSDHTTYCGWFYDATRSSSHGESDL